MTIEQAAEPKLRVTGDMIINYRNCGLLWVQRKYPPFQHDWVLAGGHIEVGKESTKECAIREAFEETGLLIPPGLVRPFRVYDDPLRDPRGHYITHVYFCTVYEGVPKAGDDAEALAIFPFTQIPGNTGFDHRNIIKDFLREIMQIENEAGKVL